MAADRDRDACLTNCRLASPGVCKRRDLADSVAARFDKGRRPDELTDQIGALMNQLRDCR
jgi:hypothetical protein